MVDRGVFSRLRSQRDRTAYRRQLTIAIERSPALRALPGLLHVPLPVVAADGSLAPLRTALTQEPFVTLAGRPGSGRRLALQQLARYLVRSRDGAETPPALINLPGLDDGETRPEELLAAELRAVTDDHNPPPHAPFWRSWPSTARPDSAPRYLLLIHGWELLTASRREAWRAALLDLPAGRTGLRAAVAVPHEEPPWPGFQPLALTAPSRALVARWLQLLCPAATRAEVEAALAPGGRLHQCSDRLFEVALLAWLAPRAGVPASRAELYERALALFGASARDHDRDPHAPLGHPQMGRFALARRVADEGRFALLAELPPPDRAETALLTAAITGDPSPILAALWRARRSGDDVPLAMGRCLRERAPASPV
ncbi:MAG TPA: hypothetical protein VNL77_05720, partial [Roseiflexaceae bacterium]|nr:hypothetical protein [Roseiflexaceae bacterium]